MKNPNSKLNSTGLVIVGLGGLMLIVAGAKDASTQARIDLLRGGTNYCIATPDDQTGCASRAFSNVPCTNATNPKTQVACDGSRSKMQTSGTMQVSNPSRRGISCPSILYTCTATTTTPQNWTQQANAQMCGNKTTIDYGASEVGGTPCKKPSPTPSDSPGE